MNRLLLVGILALCSSFSVLASDDEKLDNIYKLFLSGQVNVEEVEKSYDEGIIHIGRKDKPLTLGKQNFLNINIKPLVAMIAGGKFTYAGKAYIVRRLVKQDMANDVGYLYSMVTTPDGKKMEQVQKFSWVFVKKGQKWQVVTDFDLMQAPLTVLDDLKTERIVTP